MHFEHESRIISLLFYICSMEYGQKVEKQIPKINWNAKNWHELIDLSAPEIMEPPTTKHLSNEEIQCHMNTNVKPDITDLPSHSQSVERSVKLVSEASHYVYGFENRHSSIRTKLVSRKMRKSFVSKGHYSQCYDEIV